MPLWGVLDKYSYSYGLLEKHIIAIHYRVTPTQTPSTRLNVIVEGQAPHFFGGTWEHRNRTLDSGGITQQIHGKLDAMTLSKYDPCQFVVLYGSSSRAFSGSRDG